MTTLTPGYQERAVEVEPVSVKPDAGRQAYEAATHGLDHVVFYRVQVRIEHAHVIRFALSSPVFTLESIAERAAGDEILQLIAAVA